MTIQKIADGTVHKLPTDFRRAIESNATAKSLWVDITPLARNEWICWVTSAKQEATRKRRIEVGIDKMRGGMRRPVLLARMPAPLKPVRRAFSTLTCDEPNAPPTDEANAPFERKPQLVCHEALVWLISVSLGRHASHAFRDCACREEYRSSRPILSRCRRAGTNPSSGGWWASFWT